MKHQEIDEILTQDELAKRWKTTKRWVEHARVKYHLPYFKLGRCVRFRTSEVESWFEQRKSVA